jgi:hypothetical protein
MYVPEPHRSRHLVSALVPADPRALAAALPDVPRWVQTRALLLSGEAVVRRSARADGAVVLDPAPPAGYLVGRTDAALLRDVVDGVEDDFELVVQTEALDEARAALPGWTVAPATLHRLASPWPADGGAAPGVVVSAPPQQRWIELVPEAGEMRRYAAVDVPRPRRAHGGHRQAAGLMCGGRQRRVDGDGGATWLRAGRPAGDPQAAAGRLKAREDRRARRGAKPGSMPRPQYPTTGGSSAGRVPIRRAAVLVEPSGRCSATLASPTRGMLP